jgi:hypothetical protein
VGGPLLFSAVLGASHLVVSPPSRFMPVKHTTEQSRASSGLPRASFTVASNPMVESACSGICAPGPPSWQVGPRIAVCSAARCVQLCNPALTAISVPALQWQGKVHFGVILGWSVLAAIVLWCAPLPASCFMLHGCLLADSCSVASSALHNCTLHIGRCLLESSTSRLPSLPASYDC